MSRCEAVETLLRPPVIVEGEVLGQQAAQLVAISRAVPVDALLLHAAPQSFDEGIARCSAYRRIAGLP